MINKDTADKLTAIADSLQDGNINEQATCSVLNSLLAMIYTDKELEFAKHCQEFTKKAMQPIMNAKAQQN